MIYRIDHPKFIVSKPNEESISALRVVEIVDFKVHTTHDMSLYIYRK